MEITLDPAYHSTTNSASVTDLCTGRIYSTRQCTDSLAYCKRAGFPLSFSKIKSPDVTILE